MRRALEAGARLSREASAPRAATSRRIALWRRYRWWTLGAGLLLLEILAMHAIGGVWRF